MSTVLLLIHLFITLALIGVVLIQRSEGGGLGIGSTQGMGSLMTGRGTANLLTRSTAILGTLFMVMSLGLALLNRGTNGAGRSILDIPPAAAPAASGLPVPPVVPHAGEPGPAAAGSGLPAPATASPTAPAAPQAPQAAPRSTPSVPTN